MSPQKDCCVQDCLYFKLCFYLIDNKKLKNKFKKLFLMILCFFILGEVAIVAIFIMSRGKIHVYANLHLVFARSGNFTLARPPLMYPRSVIVPKENLF